MNAIEQAIEEAIGKGGWRSKSILVDFDKGGVIMLSEHGEAQYYFTFAEVFLDPAFWQALEKAKHWYAGEWKQKSMSFFEHVVCDGKDAESYFATMDV